MAVSRLFKGFPGTASSDSDYGAVTVITTSDHNRRLELLDDYEQAGIGWLWATDDRARLIYISENAAKIPKFARSGNSFQIFRRLKISEK